MNQRMSVGMAVLMAALALLLAVPGHAQDREGKLKEAIRNLWDDDSRENRVRSARLLIEAAEGTVPLVERTLRTGPEYRDEDKGAGSFTFVGRNQEGQHTGQYVPTSYDPAKKYPLIVWLHGGATSDRRNRGPEQVDIWKGFCEANNCLFISPSAYAGATWWELNGAFNVLRSMKLFKGKYNVDESKVFVAGFSDGGTGVYYFLTRFNTYFAGGISFSGHPSVAGAEQSYGQFSYYNLAQRPILICQGGKDRLYPPARIQPFIDDMKQYGVSVTHKVFPEAGHNPSYIADALDDVKAFMDSTTRTAARKTVTWQFDGTPALNRCDWLSINSVRAPVEAELEKLPDLNTYIGRAALGAEIDEEADGQGLLVASVVEETAAAIGDIRPGDWIRKFNDTDIATMADLEKMLSQIDPGDYSHVWIHRPAEGDELIELIVEFPPARKAFPRRKVMGTCRATVADNKYTLTCAGVEEVTILIMPELVNMDEPIQVIANGKVVYNAKLAADTQYMISKIASDRDRELIYFNQIVVKIPKPDASDW